MPMWLAITKFQSCLSLVVLLCGLVAATGQPNILFIMADDYGWNDIGYHGSEIRTPTLDKLAAEGVKLENYYVQPICSPSRSQLMTGRYQIHTGLQHGVIVVGHPYGLPLSDPTLADQLRKTGYATHLVGKWHLGYYKKEYTPTYRGFDSFYGYLTGEEDYFNHTRCQPFSNGMACGYDFHEDEDPLWEANGTYSAFLFADRAQKLVEQHVTQEPDKPLFLYLAMQSVHAPLQVPEHYMEQYDFIQNKERRIYAGMVSVLDEAVANVTDSLKKHGLWNNTILVFSTDNGGQCFVQVGNNWPLMGGKNTLWEGGMRGVGFVASPLLPNGGTVSNELVHISDWFPTLVKQAGGSTTGLKLDGYDIWDTISGKTPSPREELLHNIDPLMAHKGTSLFPHTFDTRVRAAIRWQNWKLITGYPGPRKRVPPPQLDLEDVNMGATDGSAKNLWLFDISKDPLEATDVSAQNMNMVLKLLDRLAYYNSTAVSALDPPFDERSDPARHGGVWGPWE